MISHRALRDIQRCRTKYGETWLEYERQVPYLFIPVSSSLKIETLRTIADLPAVRLLIAVSCFPWVEGLGVVGPWDFLGLTGLFFKHSLLCIKRQID
jgi:hypothetical protein